MPERPPHETASRSGTSTAVAGDGVRPADVPLVMGILNVTPDSFSDGGQFIDPDDAVAQAARMLDDGASFIDIGGESTRPDASPVAEAEELRRVIPVVEGVRDLLASRPDAAGVRISIDTTKPSVAIAAVAAGATLINDVSASLASVAADTGAGWVAMHRRGTPATMQQDPTYGDVVGEVRAYLEQRAIEATSSGVSEVWVDPGFGFGKTAMHNLSLLLHLDQIVELGFPVVVGVSRKTTAGRLTAASDARGRVELPAGPTTLAPLVVDAPTVTPAAIDDRLEASLTTATWAMVHGARMVRAHDVLATAQAARVVAG